MGANFTYGASPFYSSPQDQEAMRKARELQTAQGQQDERIKQAYSGYIDAAAKNIGTGPGYTSPLARTKLGYGGPAQLDKAYQLQQQGPVNYNEVLPQIEQRFKGVGMSESPWLKLQLEKQQLGQQDAIAQGLAGAQQAYGSGYSNLAMRGGIQSGSRERLAREAASQGNMARQLATRQGLGDVLGLRTADYDQQAKQAQFLSGIQAQEAQAKYGAEAANRAYSTDVNRFNLQNTLSAISDRNAAQQAEWEQRMKAIAAYNTARES